MELVRISDPFPYLPDGQVCVQQQIPGLMDAYIREIFQRGTALVFVEQLCKIGRAETQFLREGAEIHIIHVVFL